MTSDHPTARSALLAELEFYKDPRIGVRVEIGVEIGDQGAKE
jgi:hypothetical protein